MILFRSTSLMIYTRMKAITLVEMLLVITVIALLALGGISVVQEQTARTKVKNTVEQFESLATATRAYLSSVQTHWPTDFNQLQPYFPPTLIQSTLLNPYGMSYRLPAKTTDQLYYIATTVPDAHIARRIQGRLPFATFSQMPGVDKTEVRLYITKPSPIAWKSIGVGAQVVDIKTVKIISNEDYTVPSFTCDDEHHPEWAAGIKSFRKADDTGNWEYIAGASLCTEQASAHSLCSEARRRPFASNQLRFTLDGWSSPYRGEANVLLIRYCAPN